ncbi:MAG: hypothetical protein D3909_13805, partial [Candidatus Electrothrix sp. ATG1]|nr:hypothetical protein [Candidatus Electrothrix sp. ATG1]
MSFAFTLFVSAFFLFQVQPIIARYILPWYGGSPAVWSTCMLFFQVGLLAGYIYAHLLARYLRLRRQVILHLLLLAVSLFLLPVTPDVVLKPTGDDEPIWGIIRLLLFTVGGPYVLISSTGPLLQHWYRLKYVNSSPYRLYALSNLGSLLGLMSYPFLIEPNMVLGTQAVFWSCGYLAFTAASFWSALTLLWAKDAVHAEFVPEETELASLAKPGTNHALLWMGLSACGAVMFLAVTSKITQDISVIPFLWVLPLSLYLCTLIIAFDSPKWYRRRVWLPAFLFSCGLLTYLLYPSTDLHILATVSLYSLALFCIIMVCHGELARSKPPARHLTFFYLMTSLGGALGGTFVSFVATRIFPAYWEVQVGIGTSLILVGYALFQLHGKKAGSWHVLARWAWPFYSCTIIALLLVAMVDAEQEALTTRRNFYGVLRVYEDDKGEESHRRKLYNGQVNHGL